MNRRAGLPAAVVVVAAAAAAGWALVGSGGWQRAQAAQRSDLSTAVVQRQELSATVSVNGTLGYAWRADGTPYTVVNRAQGTYTQLPAVGQEIHQGQTLYRVNGQPVLLLGGTTPLYRPLSAGTVGPDVAQLNADLVALRYATRAQLSPVSESFGPATTFALRKLQHAVGLAASGTLNPAQAVFEPVAVRVTSLPQPLGADARPGETVILGSSARRQVQVALDAGQQTDVATGDRVGITLPDGRDTVGVVTSVASVATCGPGGGPAGGGSSSQGAGPGSQGGGPSSAGSGADTCSGAGSGSATPTVNVDVTPSVPAATGAWDQAPVQVGITTARVPHALTVPVTALLARAQGGYAVEVVGSADSRRLVPVSLGVFDDAAGLVQIIGSRLLPGQRVVVPSS